MGVCNGPNAEPAALAEGSFNTALAYGAVSGDWEPDLAIIWPLALRLLR